MDHPSSPSQEGVDRRAGFAALKMLYDAAEADIKKAEIFQGQLSIPAVNELRYAGQHLLRYLVDPHPDQLLSAQKHCLRARYDAAEGPILYFLKRIEEFQYRYADQVIPEVVPGYVDLMVTTEGIKQQIFGISKESREEYAALAGGYIDQLARINHTLEIAAVELNKRRHQQKEQQRWGVYGLTAALLGILATILLAP